MSDAKHISRSLLSRVQVSEFGCLIGCCNIQSTMKKTRSLNLTSLPSFKLRFGKAQRMQRDHVVATRRSPSRSLSKLAEACSKFVRSGSPRSEATETTENPSLKSRRQHS